MEAVRKSGKLTGFTMTEREFVRHDNDSDGACLGCSHLIVGGIEPDAREYECELCNEHLVYGMAELLVMGNIEIID